MPSTFVVKKFAQRIFLEKLSSGEININNIGARIAKSLLENEPFEPVFEIDDIFGDTSRKVRIDAVNLDEKKIKIAFTPLL